MLGLLLIGAFLIWCFTSGKKSLIVVGGMVISAFSLIILSSIAIFVLVAISKFISI